MEFFKYLSDVCQVFFWSLAEYYDVVQISYCEIEVFQNIGHQFLEVCRCLANPNGTLTYLYFPNGELKVVFRMEDLSNGMW